MLISVGYQRDGSQYSLGYDADSPTMLNKRRSSDQFKMTNMSKSTIKSSISKNFIVKSAFANKLRKARNEGFVSKSLRLNTNDLKKEQSYLNN